MAKSEKIETALADYVTANWQAVPNDHAPEGAEVLGGIILKGELEGKQMFQAICNGVAGIVRPGFPAALNDVLQKLNVVPANYDRPSKWTDVHKPNKATEPQGLEDLDKDVQKLFEGGYKSLEKVLASEDKADMNRRETAFKNAATIYDVRHGMDKGQWKLFQRFAPSAELKSFIGKNEIGEAYRSHLIRAVEGFDENVMLGARVSGNKGVVSAYQGAINLFAHNVVAVFRDDARREGVTEAEGAHAALRDIAVSLANGGIYYERASADGDAAAEGFQAPSDAQGALLDVFLPLHMANWTADVVAITTDASGSFVPAKNDGGAVCGTLFGTEGADELVSAVCRAMGRYEAAVVADAAKDVTDGLTSETKAQGKPFAQWDAGLAASHLARILFSRIGGDLEAGIADVNGILDQIGAWTDEIANGAAIDDVVGVAAPASEADAEDDADAEL